MNIEVISSNTICDYCIKKDNYYNGRSFGNICPMWFRDEICKDAEEFEGKELIEVDA